MKMKWLLVTVVVAMLAVMVAACGGQATPVPAPAEER